MALRLIEMVVKDQDAEDIHNLIKKEKILEHRSLQLSNGEVLVRILLDAVQNEEVLDLLEKKYSETAGNRIVILPVEATLPRNSDEAANTTEQKSPRRISREELYEDIKNLARCSLVYLALIVLSTIVAAVGLHDNSGAIIIGAMVIAPMLGPSIALALGTTLGDLTLLKRAILTGLAGITTVIILSTIIGSIVEVNPSLPEMASRTHVGLGHIAVALAAGSAGALSFTTGVSASLIGVMVSVALLPPLVACGLLFGAGYDVLGLGALFLFLMNLVCVNLAGVAMFLAQGIRPLSWWDKDRATKATLIAIGLWLVTLASLITLILLLNNS
ncbi:TIGR00341 family protein [Legionella yabuuchiae]|uniref:TIGR00341 family protein n=1 Tax=Legionella yabuuchiae TaxID=376727 RepID=UPI001A94581C|nr:TIGR00341 family protein [Legionella yabuuchiae]